MIQYYQNKKTSYLAVAPSQFISLVKRVHQRNGLRGVWWRRITELSKKSVTFAHMPARDQPLLSYVSASSEGQVDCQVSPQL